MDILTYAIAKKAGQGGSGSSLPPMSGSTSGQFLTNNGSAASWADVPSGALVATLSGEPLQSNVAVADIAAAFAVKTPVYLYYENGMYLVNNAENDGYGHITISADFATTYGNNVISFGLSYTEGAWETDQNVVTVPSAPYIVHITESSGTFSTTETVAEIAAAFTAGKAIQGRYHFEVSGAESIVADVNATIESYTNIANGTLYVLTVSWHDDAEATKRLYLDMTASTTTDVFSYTPNS